MTARPEAEALELAHAAIADETRGTPGPWRAIDGHGLYVGTSDACVADMSPDASVPGWNGKREDAEIIAAARTREPLIARALIAATAELAEANAAQTALSRANEFWHDAAVKIDCSLLKVTAERDAATAEVERLRTDLRETNDGEDDALGEAARAIAERNAAVQALAAERATSAELRAERNVQWDKRKAAEAKCAELRKRIRDAAGGSGHGAG